MAKPEFPVVVATDGSRTARAALATTRMFPWPDGTKVHGVVARRIRATAGRPTYVREAFDRAFKRAASDARAFLSRRWSDVEVAIIDKHPADAIVGQARLVGARVIVVGWRGHGLVRRLLLGSVSRAVVRRAHCAVVVVSRRPKHVRRLVIGLDGSINARRAVELVGALPPPPEGSATLVTALEPISMPPHELLPAAARLDELPPRISPAVSERDARSGPGPPQRVVGPPRRGPAPRGAALGEGRRAIV